MKKYYMRVYSHTPGESDAWVELDRLDIHPQLVQLLADFGIVEIKQGRLRTSQVTRLIKLQRLRGSLGVNLQGAAIILDLLERIELLQEEIERLSGR